MTENTRNNQPGGLRGGGTKQNAFSSEFEGELGDVLQARIDEIESSGNRAANWPPGSLAVKETLAWCAASLLIFAAVAVLFGVFS